MLAWRWLRALLAALFAVSLLAACGGDDDSSGDVDTEDDGSGNDGDTDDTADDNDDDSGDDPADEAAAFLDALGGEGCSGLMSLYASVFAGLGTPGSDIGETDELFDTLAEDAPDEIADDFAVLAEFMRSLVQALEDSGFDADDPDAMNDPEAMQEYMAAMTEISEDVDQEALQEAGDNITAWAESECPSLAGDG